MIRLVSCSVFLAAWSSAALLDPAVVPLRDLAGLRTEGTSWKIAGSLRGDPRIEKSLTPAEGTGLLVNAPAAGDRGSHLFTTWEHGDLELEVEYLVPVGSNSGIYLQGRYEVQVFDSWGVTKPTHADAAGIYQRWDSSRAEREHGFEGHAPRLGVSRAPGLWQHLRIIFKAPRFDASGTKTANARFVRVEHNGVLVHENVEVTGPTRSSAFDDERPTGPLMFQGDHGPVAFRNLRYRLRGGPAPSAVATRYQVYEGTYQNPDELNGLAPTREEATTQIRASLAGTTAPHALVIEGELTVPTAGLQGFGLDVTGVGELKVGRETVLTSYGNGGTGSVELAAGKHPFRLTYLRTAARGPSVLQWSMESPGADVVRLTVAPQARPAREVTNITIEPETDGIRLQRTFFPFASSKRVYAMAVGFGAQRNYAYDLAQGNLLALWTGTYVDTTAMWQERGNEQTAVPTGSVVLLDGRPSVASLGQAGSPWPPGDTALLKQRGYTLEADGQPVFHYEYSSVEVSDRIALRADGRGFDRTITVKGDPIGGNAYLLLAEDDVITSRPGGYVVGDRRYYLDLDDGNQRFKPLLRTDRGRRQLIVPLGNETGERSYRYSLVW